MNTVDLERVKVLTFKCLELLASLEILEYVVEWGCLVKLYFYFYQIYWDTLPIYQISCIVLW